MFKRRVPKRYKPEPFMAHLEALPKPEVKVAPRPEKRRGYTIRRSAATLSAQEQKQREAAAIKAIAEVMQTVRK